MRLVSADLGDSQERLRFTGKIRVRHSPELNAAPYVRTATWAPSGGGNHQGVKAWDMARRVGQSDIIRDYTCERICRRTAV